MNLGLKRHQLNEIESNHRGDNKRCKSEVLGCWLDNTTSPTWTAVTEALDEMDEHTVAENIRRKYITEGIVLLHSLKSINGLMNQKNEAGV